MIGRQMVTNRIISFSGLFLLAMFTGSFAAANESCFGGVNYATPKAQETKRALYILVDETVPLSKGMKKRVLKLLDGWGKPGDSIKIARFSASYRGLYPELKFDRQVESMPDDAFVFNLHYKDKKKVMNCLQAQQTKFKEDFAKALKGALEGIDPKIPKSELFDSLRLLSKQLIVKDKAMRKTVFLISDGLENSTVTSFYSKGKLKKINARKTIAKLRRKGKMGFWKKTEVYMYGMGLMPDNKRYSSPDKIQKLKRFWERYFVEGGGKVKEIGMPELLLTGID